MKIYYNTKTHKLHLENCKNITKEFLNKNTTTTIIMDKQEVLNIKDNESCNCIFTYKYTNEIIKYCKIYNAEYEIKFDSFFIKTNPSSWMFKIPSNYNEKIRLYHRNLFFCGNKNDYHIQFTQKISAERLIKYMINHDLYKFKLKED